MKKSMIQQYRSSMENIIMMKYPELDEDEIKEFINKIIDEKVKESSKSNDYKILYDRNGVVLDKKTREINRISLKGLDNYLANNQPIMNGYGTFFKPHDKFNNILAEMIRTLKSLRKEYKSKMFEHINDEDPSIKEMFDSRQKTTKVLNNSFYGATAEPNSIFYHPYFGPSVTYAGEDLVTIAAKAFENFLGNNIVFENIDDILIYINNIMREEYKTFDKVKFKKKIKKEELLNYLKEHLVDSNNFNVIENLFNNIEENFEEDYVDELYIYIYYKNNLMKFFDNSNIIENYFSKIIDRRDFKDPNDPPENMMSILNDIWDILNDFIFYNYQDFYRFKRIDSGDRKVVLTIDTDSNFLYLYPYFEYFHNLFPDKVSSDNDESVINIVNIIMYQMTKLVNKVMLTVTGDWNISKEFGKIINMKNEFLLKRIMLTSNKKNYASIILMQEGNIIKNPTVDVKGMAIRKVNTNKNIRDYFTKILEEEILLPDEINLSRIIYKYKQLETEIYKSLESGSLKYSIPTKANNMRSYKFPERIMALRGVINWNNYFPEEEISLPEKVNLIKLDIPDFDIIQEKIKDKDMKEKFKKVYNFENGKYTKNGIDVLCLPKKVKNIPEEFREFLDVDSMVNTNISPGIIILQSLGFKTLSILTNEFTTNILKV